MVDILIIGAGPAALSLASECAKRSLKTQVVSPSPRAPWKPNYGLWLDEIEDPSLLPCIRHQWDKPTVWLNETPQRLHRTYALFDTEALQQHLLSKCEQSGVQILSGRAVEVDAQGETASLRTEDGVALQGRVLVDASGHNTPFIERKGTFAHGHQVAVGYWMDVEQHPFQPGEMALMDFRDVPEFPEESPTFLYALPISDRTLFVEETSLVSRPALGFDALERRLHQRLEHLNLSPVAIHEKEYCQFPMGLALPKKAQRILAFGGAASMVHPATGYQLAHALRAAPGVADCLKTGLTAGPAADAVQAAWETLWPTKKRQSWELYQFGMNFLVAQNAPDTRKFFGAFFDQNDEQWQGYLSGTLPPNLVGKSMKSVFSSLDGSMRWKLIRAGASLKGLPILQAALRKSE